MESGTEAGGSLPEIIAAQGPLPADLVRQLAVDLARKLARLHAARRSHGAITPTAIRITPSSAELRTAAASTADAAGYLSPEAAAGGLVGPPADVYGLAASLVYAATGNGPFGNGAPIELLHRVLEAEPDLRAVPEPLRELLRECLAKDPDARPLAAQLVVRLDPPIPQTVRMATVATAEPATPVTPESSPTESLRPVEIPPSQAPTEPYRLQPTPTRTPGGQPVSQPYGPALGSATPQQWDQRTAGLRPGPRGLPPHPGKPPVLSRKARKMLPFLVAGCALVMALIILGVLVAFSSSGSRDSKDRNASGPSIGISTQSGPPRVYTADVGSIAVGRDARWVFAANRKDKAVSVIDAESTKLAATVPTPGTPYALAVAPDGAYVYVVTDGALAAIATTSNSVVRQTVREGHASGQTIAVAPDGRKLYVANGTKPTVTVYDTQTLAPLNTVSFGASDLQGVKLLVVSPDGRRVYVGDPHGVSVVDTATDTVIAHIAREQQPTRLAVSPDNRFLYLPRPGEGLDLVDTATNAVVSTVNFRVSGAALAVAPSGKYVFAVGMKDPTSSVVEVIDTTSRTVVDAIPAPNGFEPVLAISADGRKLYLAATIGGNELTVLDIARYA
ncbi:hypothetical protein D5S18_20775 [Nocardia panacis]|uniref:Protein kinase domain-containing protein n=1 Tax=Nocardia panacis TaxID=2340916 RepID=A0A3A4KUT0_9NOCA|nr:cytochrome D1 domain-containing protein [Nocardia panacis]RJO73624.1 hypothetical protein D5S18_20775 [Nocardia panacis]